MIKKKKKKTSDNMVRKDTSNFLKMKRKVWLSIKKVFMKS